jgi:alkylation response protein AidB-like acyl-CoA dehydrogenase
LPSVLAKKDPGGNAADLAAELPKLAALGARYDAAPTFPRESLATLNGLGISARVLQLANFTDRLEANLGLFELLRLVGRADLSLGRLFEGHVNAVQLISWYGSDEQKRDLKKSLGAGKYYGVWATEPPPGVTLSFEAEDGVLIGSKCFASGAGGLDYAVITARTTTGRKQMVLASANERERADLSGWRVRGMRATVSGTFNLSGIRVTSRELLGEEGDYEREPRFTAGAWRFTAVQLGGIEALLVEMRRLMSEAARSEPVARAQFADAVTATRTAYLWVREAARRDADEADVAASFVRMTRGVVERSALTVMEHAARVIGTRSAFDGERLDKIIRDLSLYLRQATPDKVRDAAAQEFLERDAWGGGDPLW